MRRIKGGFEKEKRRTSSEGSGGLGRAWISPWQLNSTFNMPDKE